MISLVSGLRRSRRKGRRFEIFFWKRKFYRFLTEKRPEFYSRLRERVCCCVCASVYHYFTVRLRLSFRV